MGARSWHSHFDRPASCCCWGSFSTHERQCLLRLYVTYKMISISVTTTTFAQQIVNELNTARKNPQGYASLIASYPGSQRDLQDALQFLSTVTPCNTTLSLNPGLTKVSSDWIKSQGLEGSTGHGDFIGRFQRVGTYMAIAENLAYGQQ